MNKVTVACEPFDKNKRYTGSNIAEVLGNIVADTSSEKALNLIVFDEGANMKLGVRSVKKGVKAAFCATHRLSNTVKDGFKNTPGMENSKKKVKKLAKHLNKSTLTLNRMRKACVRRREQEQLSNPDDPPHKLRIRHVPGPVTPPMFA